MFNISVCEMCGSENRLYKAKIEGTTLNVCQHCAKFGKVIGNVHDAKFIAKVERKMERKPLLSEQELMEGLVDDYSLIIKRKREELSLKQEELAKLMNEKVSVIHKAETGSFELNLELARKFERYLKIKIVEQKKLEREATDKIVSDSFTLGDFIKVRK